MRNWIIAAAAGLALPAVAQPSFDCTGAVAPSEVLVCEGAQLAALDVEMARLYALAIKGPNMTGARLEELRTEQRAWVGDRDACATAADPRVCVRDSYVVRIAGLRQGYFDARQGDPAGISNGPLVAECPGLDALAGVSFLATEPPLVHLAWRDRSLVLPLGPTGSGARYARVFDDGEYVFWVKGDEARFEMPGAEALTCKIGEPG